MSRRFADLIEKALGPVIDLGQGEWALAFAGVIALALWLYLGRNRK